LESMAELVNIGTLAAFIIVAIGIIVLRHRSPEAERPFRCPLVPLIPVLAVAFCAYLILALPTIAHLRLVIWLVIGLLIYFSYGARRVRDVRPGPDSAQTGVLMPGAGIDSSIHGASHR
ncbi:MAG: hypothetical protein MIO88_04065, partial [Methanoregulaceae archaeon]|nr:hypothetical protein [Methanoregulaceae archaeon]